MNQPKGREQRWEESRSGREGWGSGEGCGCGGEGGGMAE